MIPGITSFRHGHHPVPTKGPTGWIPVSSNGYAPGFNYESYCVLILGNGGAMIGDCELCAARGPCPRRVNRLLRSNRPQRRILLLVVPAPNEGAVSTGRMLHSTLYHTTLQLSRISGRQKRCRNGMVENKIPNGTKVECDGGSSRWLQRPIAGPLGY
jgi:hypothetical protein